MAAARVWRTPCERTTTSSGHGPDTTRQDAWTVPPSADAPTVPENWAETAARLSRSGSAAVDRYNQSLDLMNRTESNPVAAANARLHFQGAVQDAVSLFDSVHEARGTEFSPTGGGYGGLYNYLWQAGKQAGWLPALRSIRDQHVATITESQQKMYGGALPDVDTLIRRAAMFNT